MDRNLGNNSLVCGGDQMLMADRFEFGEFHTQKVRTAGAGVQSGPTESDQLKQAQDPAMLPFSS